jgi:hypothetical protein
MKTILTDSRIPRKLLKGLGSLSWSWLESWHSRAATTSLSWPSCSTVVVKIVVFSWIDYLEMADFNGEWKIIDVLWELKPKP